jgi:hypothetical protein
VGLIADAADRHFPLSAGITGNVNPADGPRYRFTVKTDDSQKATSGSSTSANFSFTADQPG